MPAAKLLNRSFLFAPEDLLLLGLISCIVYLPCCIILVVLVDKFHHATAKLEEVLITEVFDLMPGGPDESAQYQTFVAESSRLLAICYALVAMFAANFIINAAMSYACCRGSMLEESKRSAVIPLALCSIILCLAMMGPLGVLTHATNVGVDGIYKLGPGFEEFVEEFYAQAAKGDVVSLKPVCIFAWVVVVLTPVAIASLYSIFGGGRHRIRRVLSSCASLCGCSDVLEGNEAGESAIKDEVDSILQRVFGVLPLTGTDYVAGVQLLACFQKNQRQEQLALGSGGNEEETAVKIQDRLCNILTPPCLPEDLAERLAAPVQKPMLSCERVGLEEIEEASYYLPWAEMAYGTTEVLKRSSSDQQQRAPDEPGRSAQSSSNSTTQRKRVKSSMAEVNGAVFNIKNAILNAHQHIGDIKVPKTETALSARRRLICEQLKVKEEDILDIRMDNQALGLVPYFIALDRAKQSIVISIRGSASLQDALTDLITTAAPVLFITKGKGLFDDLEPPLEESMLASTGGAGNGIPDAVKSQLKGPTNDVFAWSASQVPWEELEAVGGYGHRGIVVAAAKLWDDIRSQGILAEAAAGRLPARPELANWRVLLTGHSLGAGLAALMTWALKPALGGRLFCWAYEPPGGLVSPNVAGSVSDCVVAIVHAKDLVPRMTWSTLGKLENDMMEAIACSKVNKNVLLWSRSNLNPLRGSAMQHHDLFHAEQPLEGEAATALRTFQMKMKEEELKLGIKHCHTFSLPGRIMYLRPLKGSMDIDKHTKMRGRLYDAIWVTGEQLDEDGILVGQRTTADHDFVAVNGALLSAEERARVVAEGPGATKVAVVPGIANAV